MTDAPFDARAVIDAMGPLLGLDVRPDYRPGVALNLEATARFAALLLDAPLDDREEPAPVFHP